MFILTISGFIQDQEQREFEQHFLQLLSMKPRECEAFNLAQDISNASLYHFFSLWPDKNPLDLYVSSSEYQRLNGAFRTLGFIRNTFVGELTDSIRNHRVGGEQVEDVD